VGGTQPEIGGGVRGLAVGLGLTERDRLIGGRGLCRGPGRVDRAQDREDKEDRDARALHGQGTSGPHGLAPGPLSPQSTWRRFFPSYGVGRNGNFLAMPFAVMSTPTTPGAPARKLTPSPAWVLM